MIATPCSYGSRISNNAVKQSRRWEGEEKKGKNETGNEAGKETKGGGGQLAILLSVDLQHQSHFYSQALKILRPADHLTGHRTPPPPQPSQTQMLLVPLSQSSSPSSSSVLPSFFCVSHEAQEQDTDCGRAWVSIALM